jgi:hypothetical protein
MNVRFRITADLLHAVRNDHVRPHAHAAERVGFVLCRFGSIQSGGFMILAHDYMSVLDSDYLDEPQFGASIGANAFRRVLERTLSDPMGIFHVHLHPHRGIPKPSRIDLTETAVFVPDFFHVQGHMPHGALILSDDDASGRVWLAESARPTSISSITVVGVPLRPAGGKQ